MPFEIVSSSQLSSLLVGLNKFGYKDMMESLQHLVQVLNLCMHCEKGGWISEMKQKESIKWSTIALYIEIASKLQKPIDGQVECLKGTSGKSYEKFANVYQYFWQQCRKHLIYNHFQQFSQFSANAQLYVISRLKNAHIDCGARDLDTSFFIGPVEFLTREEEEQVETMKTYMTNVGKRFKALQHYFESQPLLKKYCHFTPTYLDKTQALIVTWINEWLNLPVFFSLWQPELKRKLEEIKTFLTETVNEMEFVRTKIMNQLEKDYGTRSFIRALQKLVRDDEEKLLPNFKAVEQDQSLSVEDTSSMTPTMSLQNYFTKACSRTFPPLCALRGYYYLDGNNNAGCLTLPADLPLPLTMSGTTFQSYQSFSELCSKINSFSRSIHLFLRNGKGIEKVQQLSQIVNNLPSKIWRIYRSCSSLQQLKLQINGIMYLAS